MNREYIINVLNKKEVKQYLKENWIEHISLFWSYALWEQNENSDIDFLYERNNNKIIWLKIVKLITYFEALFNKKVDFLNKDFLNKHIKNKILSSKIDIL
jgi:predicted nucleotidyltransferase